MFLLRFEGRKESMVHVTRVASALVALCLLLGEAVGDFSGTRFNGRSDTVVIPFVKRQNASRSQSVALLVPADALVDRVRVYAIDSPVAGQCLQQCKPSIDSGGDLRHKHVGSTSTAVSPRLKERHKVEGPQGIGPAQEAFSQTPETPEDQQASEGLGEQSAGAVCAHIPPHHLVDIPHAAERTYHRLWQPSRHDASLGQQREVWGRVHLPHLPLCRSERHGALAPAKRQARAPAHCSGRLGKCNLGILRCGRKPPHLQRQRLVCYRDGWTNDL